MDKQHNYVSKIRAMIAGDEVPLDKLGLLDILHEGYCAYLWGGFCDCEPDIKYVPLWKMRHDTTPN